MLKEYDELLDIAQSMHLSVFENIPLKGDQRGHIHIDTVLLRDGLSNVNKRATLTEEILHFNRDDGNIMENNRAELRTHKKLIEKVVSFEEMLDAIIELGYSANFYTVAEILDIPVWLCEEAYKYYGSFPLRDLTYKGYIIQFNPLRVLPEEFYA